MSKMNVDGSFLNFLKMITIKGDVENKEALLVVKKDSINTSIVSADRTLALVGEIEGEFSDVGEVGIDNLPQLVQLVNSLGNDITLNFNNNKLVIANHKSKLSTVLRNAEYIVNKLDSQKFKSILDKTKDGISFVLPKEIIKDIVNKFRLIDSKEITISSDGKSLKVKSKNTDDETELESVYDIVIKDKFSVKVSSFLIDLFDSITTDVNVSLSKENPSAIHISAKQEKYKFDYLVALLVQEEEPVEEAKGKKKK